ncbi:transcriptional regulator [Lactobacillus selangorensis]|uniref:transcriptional regulator n=1 Tax=Lactobacillus selangorensis TaxID=81857 RepID=UPI0022A98F34|nr:transcriptional regulator [Lactobacillus selangorensis]
MKHAVEDILRDYPYLPTYIKNRREELLHPIEDVDENVGGSRGNKINKPQEQMIITLDDDRQLHALERQQNTIAAMLEHTDHDTRVILKELYFKRYPQYTMGGLAQQHLIYCSRASGFRKRDAFVEELSKNLGMYVAER